MCEYISKRCLAPFFYTREKRPGKGDTRRNIFYIFYLEYFFFEIASAADIHIFLITSWYHG